MNEQKNLVFFILFFIAVMAGWHFYYESPRQQQISDQQQQTTQSPTLQPTINQPVVQADRKVIIAQSNRVKINTPTLRGSINLRGGVVDDVILEKYRETTDPLSDNIVLLAPAGTKDPYYAEFGWTAAGDNLALPNDKTDWTSDQEEITATSGPVTLSWENGQGVRFERKFSIDDQYMFTIEQTVINNSDKEIKLVPYSQIVRTGTPDVQNNWMLHEGPLGYINDKLEEYNYSKVAEKNEIRGSSTGGWIGITDKYWLAALLPSQQTKSEFFFLDRKFGSEDNYITGYFGEPLTLNPGQNSTLKTNLFAGAKVLEILDNYEAELGVKHFDLAVDFGWLYFITKPLFYFLDQLYQWLGNFGLAIMALTVLAKLLFFPLANKSYRSMARMKALQPKIEKLRERFSDDKMRMNQELMDLYKREKANPISGCLPLLIQLPVFLALYKVIFVTIEMRQAPFYGWIKDLSVQDPTSLFNLFGLIPWDPPSLLHVGLLPILMGASMWFQQRLNPAPADPAQQKAFMLMPFFFTFLFAQFPAGLVLYWTWNNILSIAQQWIIMRTANTKATSKA